MGLDLYLHRACEVCPCDSLCGTGFRLELKINVLVCLESMRWSLVTAG